MRALREGDTVRIVSLREPAIQHLLVTNSPRPPRLGDVGVIIEVQGTVSEPRYVVESDDGDGEIVWLAAFQAHELVLEAEFERQ